MGICGLFLVASLVIVNTIVQTMEVVEHIEVLVTGRELEVLATIRPDVIGFTYLMGFVAAAMFLLGIIIISNWVYPVKRFVVVQK